MSTWTNEFDVFRDLDRLSGIQHSNVTYPSSNAFGRGKLIIKEDQHGRRTTVAQFSPPPKIPVAQSCPEGEMAIGTEEDSTWDRDRDLYLQLREICGRGHSNELIEEEFGQMESHSQEQSDDASCLPGVEDFLEEESNNLITLEPDHPTSTLNKPMSQQLKTSDTELLSSDANHSQARLFVRPPKLKPSRNALLNSLARMKILQLSEETEMTCSPSTCHEKETGHITDNSAAGTKHPQTDFLNGHSHCGTGDRLETPNVDSLKLEICNQTPPYGEIQKQSINWSDIRKRKVSGYSPAFMNSSDGSSANAFSSQLYKQDSKVKSYAATSSLDLPGFSASSNSLYEERSTSDLKQDDQKKQDLSHRTSSVQSNSKTKWTKECKYSLPSSPTSSVTPNENISWTSIRPQSSHPKNIMLSDYIEPICSLGSESTHNFCEVSVPQQEELRNSDTLQIQSVKDFPPLD